MKQPEHDLQVRCVKWFQYQYPHLRRLFFSVPNGGSRPKATASRMKAEGITPGVADLILLLPNYYHHSLNIEMKAGCSQSEAQVIYETCCHASGNCYTVCRSLDDFKATVTGYLASVDENILYQLREIHAATEQARAEKAKKEYQKLLKRTSL